MNISFFGAARAVTGSKHILEHEGTRVLLDCGLHQGRRQETYELNKKLPFSPTGLSAVILSHAHADHCAALPLLIKEGYRGKIYATPATADIAHLIMLDSAKIQHNDYEHLLDQGIPAAEILSPLYTVEDVEKTIELFSTVEYVRQQDEWTEISDTVRFKFYDAGHILGSAVTLLECQSHNETKRLLFTGDLGNGGVPILHDPAHIPETVETVIIECTYGNRLHRSRSEVDKVLITLITEAVEGKKKIIVPAFALGRTQELIYILHRLYQEQKIPSMPIYIDSPLSNRITEVFSKYVDDFDEESHRDFINHQESPFAFKNLHYVTTQEESKRLNQAPGPMMIIASSGMAEGGRILHHLEHNIWKEDAIIMLVGYQAEHTLGRKIFSGQAQVPIFGKEHELKAKVVTLNEFSAHADQAGLLRYLQQLDGLQRVFLVHGEEEALQTFKEVGEKKLSHVTFTIPAPGDHFPLS